MRERLPNPFRKWLWGTMAFVNFLILCVDKRVNPSGVPMDLFMLVFCVIFLVLCYAPQYSVKPENHVDRWAKGYDLQRKPGESDDSLRARCRVEARKSRP